jgi:hypothetical protein
MNGEVVYLYAYDIAYEADLTQIEKQMRGTATRFRLHKLKDAPRSFAVYQPLTIQIEDMQLEGPVGPLTLRTSMKLFSVGAISVQVRVPVSCQRVTDLVVFRDLRFSDGATLDERVKEIAQQLFEGLKTQLDTPVSALAQPEVYTIFCLDTPWRHPADDAVPGSVASMEQWLRAHEREVAALLDDESDAACLSQQEVQETMKYSYSYYRHDLTVLDWDAALVVDHPEGFQDTLYVLEVANLQLEELKVYDVKLDGVLEKAYDDVEVVTRPHAMRARQRVLNELREIRMDLTKVADELSNITKFFGDWHLARIYMGCATRFHLSQWEDMVNQKLRALDGLYTILQQDSMNRVMLMLEVAVVALFVIDLVIIAVLGIK